MLVCTIQTGVPATTKRKSESNMKKFFAWWIVTSVFAGLFSGVGAAVDLDRWALPLFWIVLYPILVLIYWAFRFVFHAKKTQ